MRPDVGFDVGAVRSQGRDPRGIAAPIHAYAALSACDPAARPLVKTKGLFPRSPRQRTVRAKDLNRLFVTNDAADSAPLARSAGSIIMSSTTAIAARFHPPSALRRATRRGSSASGRRTRAVIRAEQRTTVEPISLDPNVRFYQIRAMIRPWRLSGVIHALNEYGVRGLTTYPVSGAGVQIGNIERYAGGTFDESNQNLVDKTVIEVVVVREQCQEVVDTIVDAAQTGEIGDGKIFLSPVHDIVRIRTGEVGVAAERMKGGRADLMKSKD